MPCQSGPAWTTYPQPFILLLLDNMLFLCTFLYHFFVLESRLSFLLSIFCLAIGLKTTPFPSTPITYLYLIPLAWPWRGCAIEDVLSPHFTRAFTSGRVINNHQSAPLLLAPSRVLVSGRDLGSIFLNPSY